MRFTEYGTIKKKAINRFALIYPDVYRAGNSNLGLHYIYNIVNEAEGFSVERFFLDFERSIESQDMLKNFKAFLFSLNYEYGIINLLKILKKNNIPLLRENRKDHLVITGGPLNVNPFILDDVFDIAFIGDAEKSLVEFLDIYSTLDDPKKEIDEFGKIEGLYIPEIHKENKIKRRIEKLTYHPLYEPIQWGDFEESFNRTFLLEVSRGCRSRCAFCLTGNALGPYRERSKEELINIIKEGQKRTKFEKIALIGSDMPSSLDEIIKSLSGLGFQISLPSLKLMDIDEKTIPLLGQDTITLAPESSESLRCEVGKYYKDEEFFDKISLIKKYSKSVKLYFIFGLPGEEQKDLDEIINFIKISRKIIRTKSSFNPFVPKPHTPFEDHIFDFGELKEKMKYISTNIKDVRMEDLKGAFIQYVISLGGRDVGKFIIDGVENSKNLTYSSFNKAIEQDEIEVPSNEKEWKRIEVSV
ncbi:MAG: Ribosomal protein S12 methylthiotransferase RimO [Candidatus Methanofastidiosum methylothiophilum]|uniref:Ribosomal protein S12 methylthiotransferase RimO n=1 Tax=Candidatus Methanofastidiosum methylothiophilum TaxID=1705564 RepID=A0A150IMC3_9EURY|nr:MAG: Ribosomal protein S12 methylthiotransferase RimO [Candidatus Methanofastidiosum methylthiophilus]KYC48783.1 MAG: Ribosomal protein S12 methylthiotransferase RimO [Candidatus Methanofastidiosum methylthiophilus]KYC51431.1 MAG: Ribosomal protein S12 methylthiotransferase RimO [Candidatus Methanofastidiosum methylthiophilus]